MEATAVVQLMTGDEARQCADQIRRGMADVRHLLLDFHEREGWRALGYDTWRECAMAEFGYEQSRVYQLLEAARVERNLAISTTVEKPVPERHLRPLTKLEPTMQHEVWKQAVATAPEGKVTAKHVEHTVTQWQYDKGNKDGGAATKSYMPPVPVDDEDIPDTVTLRVARVVYLLAMGKHMALDEIARITGLSVNGAWRLMNRLAGGHHVPVTEYDGAWCILGVDSRDMPY
jgi:hypothetical protein